MVAVRVRHAPAALGAFLAVPHHLVERVTRKHRRLLHHLGHAWLLERVLHGHAHTSSPKMMLVLLVLVLVLVLVLLLMLMLMPVLVLLILLLRELALQLLRRQLGVGIVAIHGGSI